MNMSGKVKFWSYFGAVVGVYGWFIGFTLLCLFSEQYEPLAEVFIPGFLISGIMAGFLILVMESVLHRFGPRSPMLQVGLWGVLLSELGLLIFLLNKWLSVVMKSRPELLRALNEMDQTLHSRTIYETGDLAPNLLMAAGLALLVVLLVGFFRSNGLQR